jgi:cytochrome c-type biogenesis protein CcmE
MTPEPSPSRKRRSWQPKHSRMAWLAAGAATLGLAAFLALNALQDNLTFFYSPTDLEQAHLQPGRTIRLGGMVADGSLVRLEDGLTVEFAVTDYKETRHVRYSGILPDLFREGQGVVAIGMLAPDGAFLAEEILAKHDEKYMPPEVAAALDKGRAATQGAEGPMHQTSTLAEPDRAQ